MQSHTWATEEEKHSEQEEEYENVQGEKMKMRIMEGSAVWRMKIKTRKIISENGIRNES